MQLVAVGWQVYDITRDPLDLGLIGLSQFLPFVLLIMPGATSRTVGGASACLPFVTRRNACALLPCSGSPCRAAPGSGPCSA